MNNTPPDTVAPPLRATRMQLVAILEPVPRVPAAVPRPPPAAVPRPLRTGLDDALGPVQKIVRSFALIAKRSFAMMSAKISHPNRQPFSTIIYDARRAIQGLLLAAIEPRSIVRGIVSSLLCGRRRPRRI